MLWNPSTGEGRTIPLPPLEKGVLRAMVSMGLGFDGVNFRVIRLCPTLSTRRSIIETFSVEDNIWKKIGHPVTCVPCKNHCSFVIEGVSYWESDACDACLGTNNVSLFWCDGELHGEFPYPVLDQLGSVSIVSLDDQIVALSSSKQHRRIQSYYLESNGSWSKGSVIGPFDFLSRQVADVKGFKGRQERFLNVHLNLPLNVPHVENFSTPDWSEACSYVETLLAIDSTREGAVLITEENL